MSLKSPVVFGALALVVGVGSGLVSGAYVVSRYEAQAKARPAAVQVPVVQSEGASAPSYQALQKSLMQGAAAAARAEDRERSPTAQEVDAAREERAKRWHGTLVARERGVQAEARNPVWASKTEAAFEHDFAEKVGTFEARLLDIDCRATGCLARVEWDSYQTAMNKFQEIPHSSFSTNCATSVDIGAAPQSPAGPHQATVVFTCQAEQGS